MVVLVSSCSAKAKSRIHLRLDFETGRQERRCKVIPLSGFIL